MKYLFSYHPHHKPEFYLEQETQFLLPEKPTWLQELEEGGIRLYPEDKPSQWIDLSPMEREPCASNCRYDDCEACTHELDLCG